jgi:NAD-specific glutamate dehydrogenase
VDTSIRLRIATRIHFALLRHYGEDVEVGTLLRNEADAREALWVCDASGDAELAALARQFRHAERAEAKAPPAQRAPQDLAWARNTSGFGLTRPLELEEAAASGFAASSWLKPSTWLKRSAVRPAR